MIAFLNLFAFGQQVDRRIVIAFLVVGRRLDRRALQLAERLFCLFGKLRQRVALQNVRVLGFDGQIAADLEQVVRIKIILAARGFFLDCAARRRIRTAAGGLTFQSARRLGVDGVVACTAGRGAIGGLFAYAATGIAVVGLFAYAATGFAVGGLFLGASAAGASGRGLVAINGFAAGARGFDILVIELTAARRTLRRIVILASAALYTFIEVFTAARRALGIKIAARFGIGGFRISSASGRRFFKRFYFLSAAGGLLFDRFGFLFAARFLLRVRSSAPAMRSGLGGSYRSEEVVPTDLWRRILCGDCLYFARSDATAAPARRALQ